ncbi:MAG: DUF3990 domain-containing protein [Lachnospiraceae bacterium]|nr:DUF3990 domain-containing protein [Lachnospiraceae bacterium]
MKLFHTSDIIIKDPDIFHGRKNADFGQGFYLSPDYEFCKRWASKDAYINEYEFDTEGLDIVRLSRDSGWFDYIFANRRFNDTLDADVIIGPIANDTIYDTFGILSSGFLDPADALKLLLIGPEYTQVSIKSEKAKSHLKWLKAEKVSVDDSIRLKRTEEESAYQADFAKCMEEIGEEDEA